MKLLCSRTKLMEVESFPCLFANYSPLCKNNPLDTSTIKFIIIISIPRIGIRISCNSNSTSAPFNPVALNTDKSAYILGLTPSTLIFIHYTQTIMAFLQLLERDKGNNTRNINYVIICVNALTKFVYITIIWMDRLIGELKLIIPCRYDSKVPLPVKFSRTDFYCLVISLFYDYLHYRWL